MNLYSLRNWISIIKQKIYCNTEGFVYEKSDDIIPEIIPKLNVQIEVIKNEECLNKYGNNADIRRVKERLRYFLNKGCIGYFAIYNKELVSSCWVCDLKKYHPDLYLNNPVFHGDNNYYVFYGKTGSNYRKKGIFNFIYTQILKDISVKPRKIFGFIDPENVASQKSAEKIGFKKIGTLKHFQIFQWILLSKFDSDEKI